MFLVLRTSLLPFTSGRCNEQAFEDLCETRIAFVAPPTSDSFLPWWKPALYLVINQVQLQHFPRASNCQYTAHNVADLEFARKLSVCSWRSSLIIRERASRHAIYSSPTLPHWKNWEKRKKIKRQTFQQHLHLEGSYSSKKPVGWSWIHLTACVLKTTNFQGNKITNNLTAKHWSLANFCHVDW